jgi:NADPH-dependent curcumin reductase CurA
MTVVRTLDATLENMAFGGKIIACGSIATYDQDDTTAKMKNIFQIVVNALTIQGYLVTQFLSSFEAGNQELLNWIRDGTIVTRETIVDGLDKAPQALIGLFHGANTGKMLVRVKGGESGALKDEL